MKIIYETKAEFTFKGFNVKRGFFVLTDTDSNTICFSSGWHQRYADGTVLLFVYRRDKTGCWSGDWELVGNYYPDDGEDFLIQWDEEILESGKWVYASHGKELAFGMTPDDACNDVVSSIAEYRKGVIRDNGSTVYYYDGSTGNLCRATNFVLPC